jgi:phosphoadenosine phosphosulfate reductase
MNDLLQEARWILRECAPSELLLGAFSGGKDSIAIHRVCEIEGIAPEWHYHVTTIDPPEVVKFIKNNYPHVLFDRPKYGNFFSRAKEKKILPSRKYRWCCDEYKESRGPLNCVWITGVRREESSKRASDVMVGMHRRTRRIHIRPLSNWDTEFVWEFIRHEKLEYPKLYDEGFRRLGCVGCPLASRDNRKKEMIRWPKIGRKWIELAKYHYDLKKPWDNFNTFVEFFDAWLSGKF